MNQQQVMALAAMCQITKFVQQVAHTGQITEQQLSDALSGILVTDPKNPEDVFAELNLRQGYRLIVQQLESGSDKSVELVKYVGGLIQLERLVSGKPSVLAELGRKIDDMHRRTAHFELHDESMVAGLADIYANVISPLGQRIQVFGKPELLKQPHVQNKIRALLLAGIRAAVLWRQLGGKRRHFFFSKGKIVKIAKANS